MAAMGSSPQVRGICVAVDRDHAAAGIIPAGAGHFRHNLEANPAEWDHPRRCGAFMSYT